MPDRPPLPEPFRCDVVAEPGGARVALVGELDLATGQILERTLEEIVDTGTGRVIVDLRGLAFMDSSGLRLLLRWDGRAREQGAELLLIAGPPAVQRVFETTRLLERLHFADPPPDG
jgi:anti-anti-sigma factor